MLVHTYVIISCAYKRATDMGGYQVVFMGRQ